MASGNSSALFDDLFVFEVANNHEGQVAVGEKIIDAMGDITQKHGLNAAVKFQYRDLDTFIHPDYKDRDDVKHIPRFLANRLSWDEFKTMVDRVRNKGMKAMVTPFDEASVGWCVRHDVDIIKVASCSATDWPLLEAVADAGKPVIISTGGLAIDQIDDVVSFFSHRGTDFALMHCVALYPTPNDELQMSFMERMINRYPHVAVGYSGHEAPENIDVGKVAVSKGARMLERHVGVTMKEKPELNAYSMTPEQTERWVKEALVAREIAGSDEKAVSEEERESLLSLQRGVFAKRAIAQGEVLKPDDVFFAMPAQPGQLTSGEFGRYRTRYVASKDYAVNEGVYEEAQTDSISALRTIIHDAKGMLHEAQIQLGRDFEIELSHHHGLEQFREYGALIVNVINREYCKKLLVMLPGQQHPNHYHRQKEETFHLLWGDLQVNLHGEIIELSPGDKVLVERNTWHSFSTREGAIVEEISTTHVRGDSFYEDERIAGLDPMERKTLLEDW